MKQIIAALLVLTLSGCSSLILRNDDTTMETTGKVAARVVLAPVTIGFSERFIYGYKQEEVCINSGGTYNFAWATCSTYGGGSIDPLAAVVMMNTMNNVSANMARPIQLAPPAQQPIYQPQRQCYTSPMGNSFYTTCY